MTTKTTTKTTEREYPKTIAALRSKDQNEWELGDALHEEIPQSRVGVHNEARWEALAEELTQEGLDFKADTLRQYRDAAAKWTKPDRVQGVSFSAHRAASPIEKRRGAGSAKVTLERLKANDPHGRVTVAAVKEAVKPAGGKQQAAKDHARTLRNLEAALEGVDKDFAKYLIANHLGSIEPLLGSMAKGAQLIRDAQAAGSGKAKAATPKVTATSDPKASAAKRKPAAKGKARGRSRGI